jgi:2'-5' RNA ligase
MATTSEHLQNDSFGFACYILVIPAPDRVRVKCDEIERAAGQTRAKIPAHVTVKGTMYGIESLQALRDAAREVVGAHHAFFLSFDRAEPHWSEDTGVLRLSVNPEIKALHHALVAGISPLGRPAYRDDPYRAHMTFVQNVTPEGLAIAREMVAASDFGAGFDVAHVDLMGREGPAWGGRWKLIERFGLAKADAGHSEL